METQKKHAYLIMAHHRPDVIGELLAALDDPRNDIYLHMDRKSAAIGPDGFEMRFSRLTLIPPMDVSWGGYSQIECTLRLLKAAVKESEKNGDCYSRYHLMTGATYPIKSQDEIHTFFDRYPDREYMDFDEPVFEERVRYIHLFNESGLRPDEHDIRMKLRRLFAGLQQRLGCDRFGRFGMECRKGLAYWSITHELAEYVIQNRKLIRRMMKHSISGDEIFMQTLVWNSSFRDRAFDAEGRAYGSMRLTTWPLEDAGEPREDHCLMRQDLPYILGSDALFALKFDGACGMELIDAVKESIEGHYPCEVSVIIPAYNIAGCIGRAVRSILDGSFQDIEILLIDDGSADGTLEECRRLGRTDSRIRVYHKENGGAGSARNHGLERAEGKYIAFIDGDDTVATDYLEKLTALMDSEKADWAICHYKEQWTEDGRVCKENICQAAFPENTAGTRDEACRAVFRSPAGNNFHSNAMCLYRRSIIAENGLSVREDLSYGEDTLFNYEYAHHIRRFAYTPEPLYMYIQREDSSKHRIYSGNAIGEIMLFIEKADEVIQKYSGEDEGNGAACWPDEAVWYAYRQIYFILHEHIIQMEPGRERKAAFEELSRRLRTGRCAEVFRRVPEVKTGIKGRALYALLRLGNYRLFDTVWRTASRKSIID